MSSGFSKEQGQNLPSSTGACSFYEGGNESLQLVGCLDHSLALKAQQTLTILRFFFLFSSPHTYFHWSKTNPVHTALTACTCMYLMPVLSSGLCSLYSCCSFSPDTSFPFLCIFSNPYHSSRSRATSILHTASPECSLVFPHSFVLVLVSLCYVSQSMLCLWSL